MNRGLEGTVLRTQAVPLPEVGGRSNNKKGIHKLRLEDIRGLLEAAERCSTGE